MAKTLYDYWFAQFDFPNEQGNPYKLSGGKMVYNTKLKREIPEGWEIKKLSSMIEIQKNRLSGQEPRLIFIEEFKKLTPDLFYSVETPTIEKFSFGKTNETIKSDAKEQSVSLVMCI